MKLKIFNFGRLTPKQQESVEDKANKFMESVDVVSVQAASNNEDGAILFVTYNDRAPKATKKSQE